MNNEFVERERERVIAVLQKNFEEESFAAYLDSVMGLESWLQRQVQLPGSATQPSHRLGKVCERFWSFVES